MRTTDFRMRPQALRAAIEADLAAGLSPACVVAAVGSTNVGAIDPLDDIADLCDEFDLWLHVDGAYGGIVGLDPAYTQMTSAMCRVNSLESRSTQMAAGSARLWGGYRTRASIKLRKLHAGARLPACGGHRGRGRAMAIRVHV